MAEHDWEELFVVRDCPRGSGRPDPIYAGVDRCNNCKLFRIVSSKPGFPEYFRPGWWSPVDPGCKEDL